MLNASGHHWTKINNSLTVNMWRSYLGKKHGFSSTGWSITFRKNPVEFVFLEAPSAISMDLFIDQFRLLSRAEEFRYDEGRESRTTGEGNRYQARAKFEEEKLWKILPH